MDTKSMASAANSTKKSVANSTSESFINSTPKSFANSTSRQSIKFTPTPTSKSFIKFTPKSFANSAPTLQNKSTQGSSANSTPRTHTTYTNLTQRWSDFTPRYSLSSQINSQYPEQNSLPRYLVLPLTLKQLSLTLQQYLLYFNNYYKLMKYKSIEILVRFHGYHSNNHSTYIITDETMFMSIQIKNHIFKMSQQQQDFSKYYRLIVKFIGKQDLYSKGVALNIEVQTVRPVIYQQQIEQHWTRAMIIQSQINLFWQESDFKDQLKMQILDWIKKNKKFELQEIKFAFLNLYDPHVFRMIFEQFQDQISDKLIDHGAIYQYKLEQNQQSQQKQKQNQNQEKQQQSLQEQQYDEQSQQKQQQKQNQYKQEPNKQVCQQQQSQQEQQQSQQEQQYSEKKSQQSQQQDSRMIQQKDEISDEINENKTGE